MNMDILLAYRALEARLQGPQKLKRPNLAISCLKKGQFLKCKKGQKGQIFKENLPKYIK
jgi:hypothetical protein